jgi:hypothetical protein
MPSMTTHPSYKAIVNAVVLAHLLIALFAILLAALLLSLLTYMGAACCAIAAPAFFCGYSAPPRTRKWELLFPCSFAQGDWGGVVCNQEIARIVGSLSALQAGKAKEALRQPLSFSSCLLALPDEKITMRKYLLSVLAIIAETVELNDARA